MVPGAIFASMLNHTSIWEQVHQLCRFLSGQVCQILCVNFESGRVHQDIFRGLKGFRLEKHLLVQVIVLIFEGSRVYLVFSIKPDRSVLVISNSATLITVAFNALAHIFSVAINFNATADHGVCRCHNTELLIDWRSFDPELTRVENRFLEQHTIFDCKTGSELLDAGCYLVYLGLSMFLYLFL